MVGSFNVQNFGKKKIENEDVVDVLEKIIRCHDIIAIQEVSDKSEKSINEMLNILQSDFNLELSERTGNSPATEEQYAVFYKPNKAKVLGSQLYPNPGQKFVRSPYAVHMKTLSTVFDELILVTVHLSPKRAFQEIHELVAVRKWASNEFQTQNVIILGDFNASRPYIKDWQGNALKNNPDYHWLIQDHVDTTATGTLASYDRIVIHGQEILQAIDKASVLRYDEKWELAVDLKTVSDHYPIQVRFKPKLHSVIEDNISTAMAIVLSDNRSNSTRNKLNPTRQFNKSGNEVFAVFSSVDGVDQALKELREANRDTISNSLTSMIKHHVKRLIAEEASSVNVRLFDHNKHVMSLITVVNM